MRGLRDRLTYANVMASVAVFLALTGVGIAAFKVPKNSVGTKQLKNNAVKSSKVAPGSLTGVDIDASTLGVVPEAADADALGGEPPSAFQDRVTGTCAAGNAIQSIAAAGTVTCQPTGSGTITGVEAGTGLTGGGSSGNVTLDIDPDEVGDVQTAAIPGVSPSSVGFGAVSGATPAGATTVDVTSITPSTPLVARDFTARFTSAPGPGEEIGALFIVNGSTALDCLVEGPSAAVTCSDADDVAIPPGSQMYLQVANATAVPQNFQVAFRLTGS